MALDPNINTRGIDFEEKGKLLNVAEVTLTSAASANSHPVRKQEFDSAVATLEAAIAGASGAFHAYVDTTSATLTTALDSAVFAAGAWTFGGTTVLHVGDTLFLDMATQQDSDRAWQMVAATGNDSDFKAFGSDIDQAIANAVNAVKGNATTYTNLGLVEDKLDGIDLTLAAMQAAEALSAKTKEYPVTWGAPDVNGVKTATISTVADFNTHKVSVRVLKVKAGGFYEQLSSTALLVESSNSAVRLQTDSGSITAATLVVIVSGTPEL